MTNFFKGQAFFIFGVLLSPLCAGMLAPIMMWELTESVLGTSIVSVVYLTLWVFAREAMINRKWHYCI